MRACGAQLVIPAQRTFGWRGFQPPPRRLCFQLCPLVGWFVKMITQKLLSGFPRNIDWGWVLAWNRSHYVLVRMWIKWPIQDFFFSLSLRHFFVNFSGKVFMVSNQAYLGLQSTKGDCWALRAILVFICYFYHIWAKCGHGDCMFKWNLSTASWADRKWGREGCDMQQMSPAGIKPLTVQPCSVYRKH